MVVTMLYHHFVDGATWATCWKLTHPNSKAKPESARALAHRHVKWYQERSPDDLRVPAVGSA